MKKIEWVEIQHVLEIAFERIDPKKTQLYYELLKHFDGNIVGLAVRKLLSERVWSKFPTVGDISQAVADLQLGTLPSPTQAWGEVMTAIRRYGNLTAWIDMKPPHRVHWERGEGRQFKDSFDDAVDSLTPITGKFLASCGREYYVQLCAEIDGFSQQRFEKSFAEFRVKTIQDLIALPDVAEQKRISATNKLRLK